MTANKGFKQRVRARASKTGESYTAALQHLRNGLAAGQTSAPHRSSTPKPIRIAVAQADPPADPRDRAALQHAGRVIRSLMDQARGDGAALIHFGEGAICAPGKRIISSDPHELADADWSRFDWHTQRHELRLIAEHAAELGLWTVVGAVHRLSAPRRPYNSLYVIDDHGRIVTRYDERMLSFTKVSYMYTPGAGPVTFDVDGVRFGCALGMESVYPEVFMAYEKDDVDCVLFSSHGPNTSFAVQVQGHASTNGYWVSYATTCSTEEANGSGVAGRNGAWLARCTGDKPVIALTEINGDEQNLARPWRRRARGQLAPTASSAEDPRAARETF
jgi:predicted amidohydrolase